MEDETKISLTISQPDLLSEGTSGDTRVYYRFFEETTVSSKYLAVVIRLLDGEGFIVTAYFTERIKREKILWHKGPSS